MEASSLREIYASINKDVDTIYVVPLIRHNHKKTDYLYLLYEELLQSDTYKIKSISVFDHFKLVIGILTNKKAILHYHWLEFQDFKSLLGMPWKMLCIYLFQLLGGNIVWTLHNEFPHDQRYLKLHRYLHKKMADWSEILHVHCETAIPIMSKRLQAPKDKFRLVPHPQFPADPVPRSTAISNLADQYNCKITPDDTLLLMFGNISRYKQIEQVADIIIQNELSCKLTIAGPVKKGNIKLYDELLAKVKQSNKIILIPEFIPEDRVSWFYSAADLCVFNYREILSSGGFYMAKAYNKKIIAPRLGCLSEMEHLPNVTLFDHPDELITLLRQKTMRLDDQA